LSEVFFLIFNLISSFKAWCVVSILSVQAGFDVDVFDFQIEHWCIFLAFFGVATVLATFWSPCWSVK
jgi:hypothetical protein